MIEKQLIYEALQSLVNIYKHKNSSADDLRRNLTLNLSAAPNWTLQPTFIDTVHWNRSLFYFINWLLIKIFFARSIAIICHLNKLNAGLSVSKDIKAKV